MIALPDVLEYLSSSVVYLTCANNLYILSSADNFNYAVNEAAVINVSSAVNRKSVLKKLLSEIKAVTGTAGRHQLHIRNAGSIQNTFQELVLNLQFI